MHGLPASRVGQSRPSHSSNLSFWQHSGSAMNVPWSVGSNSPETAGEGPKNVLKRYIQFCLQRDNGQWNGRHRTRRVPAQVRYWFRAGTFCSGARHDEGIDARRAALHGCEFDAENLHIVRRYHARGADPLTCACPPHVEFPSQLTNRHDIAPVWQDYRASPRFA